MRSWIEGGGLAAVIAAVAAAVITPPAAAQSPAEFYQGKTMKFLVSSAPGGGYDQRARIFARHFPRMIPGVTSLVVENMPGAGGMVAVNYTYNNAPKDGTLLCMFQRSVTTTSLLQPAGARFDLLRLNWLGSMGPENGLVVTWHTSPIQTTEDLFRKEAVVGMPGVSMTPFVFNALIGTKMRPISGYPGSRELQIAMERGELMGLGEWSWSDIKTLKRDWLESGKLRLLLQIGASKHKDLPHVPLAQEFARTEEDRRLLDFTVSTRQLAFPMILPPDVPADRVTLLRSAFMKLASDPEFKAEMDKVGIEYDFMSGEAAQEFVRKTVASLTPQMAERLKAAEQRK